MTIFFCSGNKGKINEIEQAVKGKEDVLGLKDIGLTSYREPLENTDIFIANGAIKLFSALQFIVKNPKNKINKILVDDSGLCVPDLNFEPGVHSATFAGLPRNDEKNNQLLMSKVFNSNLAHQFHSEKRLNAFFVSFLFFIDLRNLEDFNFIKSESFYESNSLLKEARGKKNLEELEKKFLDQINLKQPSGSFSEKINMNFFNKNYPPEINILIACGYCCGEVSSQDQNLIIGAGHGYDPLFYPLINREKSFASITLEQKNKLSHRAFALQQLNI